MISKKTLIAGIFSVVVGVGMLAMPVRAMAHDWDHDGDGRGRWHQDNGRHNGWYNHGPGNNGWYNHGEEEEEEHENQGYYAPPNYGYGYGQQGDDDDDDGGYGYGYGNGYGYGGGWNGIARVNPRHPGLMWACDSHGHHCHWARRAGYGYGAAGVNPFGGYYGNNGYGNNGYSPLGGLGSLLGIPMP